MVSWVVPKSPPPLPAANRSYNYSTGATPGGELGVGGFGGGPFLALAKGDGRMYGAEPFLWRCSCNAASTAGTLSAAGKRTSSSARRCGSISAAQKALNFSAVSRSAPCGWAPAASRVRLSLHAKSNARWCPQERG